jgi:hypothetical protein
LRTGDSGIASILSSSTLRAFVACVPRDMFNVHSLISAGILGLLLAACSSGGASSSEGDGPRRQAQSELASLDADRCSSIDPCCVAGAETTWQGAGNDGHGRIRPFVNSLERAGCTQPSYFQSDVWDADVSCLDPAGYNPQTLIVSMCPSNTAIPVGTNTPHISTLPCAACLPSPRDGWIFLTWEAAGNGPIPIGCGAGGCPASNL